MDSHPSATVHIIFELVFNYALRQKERPEPPLEQLLETAIAAFPLEDTTGFLYVFFMLSPSFLTEITGFYVIMYIIAQEK